MTTETTADTDVLAELAKLDTEWAAPRNGIGNSTATSPRSAGSWRAPIRTPWAHREPRKLHVDDPVQFKADGTPTGPDAKKLAAAIAVIGDLAPLADEVEHARLLAAPREAGPWRLRPSPHRLDPRSQAQRGRDATGGG